MSQYAKRLHEMLAYDASFLVKFYEYMRPDVAEVFESLLAMAND